MCLYYQGKMSLKGQICRIPKYEPAYSYIVTENFQANMESINTEEMWKIFKTTITQAAKDIRGTVRESKFRK